MNIKTLTSIEQKKQNKLQIEKPYVFQKCLKFDEKIDKKESIAIIQFQYDYHCNFKCQHCSIQRFQVDNRKEFFTPEKVKNLARQADEMGLYQFVLTGGEPLIFKDYDMLVKAIDPSKFFITSDTNGWFLNEDKAKHLKSIGVDKIQLSIDSLNADEHDAFRRKAGSHERCIIAIDAAQKANLDIMVQTVADKKRLHSQEFIDFIKFLNDKNVPVFTTFLKPVGCLEGSKHELINQDDIAYMEQLEKKYNVFTHLTPGYGYDFGCIALKKILSITKYGDLMPCPYIHVSLGNVFEEPLKDIIDRGLKIKYFGEYHKTCWIAMDQNFIENVIEKKINGKQLPVSYKEVFTKEDFI